MEGENGFVMENNPTTLARETTFPEECSKGGATRKTKGQEIEGPCLCYDTRDKMIMSTVCLVKFRDPLRCPHKSRVLTCMCRRSEEESGIVHKIINSWKKKITTTFINHTPHLTCKFNESVTHRFVHILSFDR